MRDVKHVSCFKKKHDFSISACIVKVCDYFLGEFMENDKSCIDNGYQSSIQIQKSYWITRKWMYLVLDSLGHMSKKYIVFTFKKQTLKFKT